MAILKIRDADENVREIQVIKGKDGKDYVLTDADKQEIANLVELEDYYTKEEIDIANATSSHNNSLALAQVKQEASLELLQKLGNYYTKEELPAETWTFTLEDGSTVNKTVVLR